MKESDFQKNLIDKIKQKFPDCIVMKNDPNYIQGIPDLIVLYKNKWATLECKKKSNSKRQPNQDYYISKMNKMSFSSFIYSGNEKEVLDELQRTFES